MTNNRRYVPTQFHFLGDAWLVECAAADSDKTPGSFVHDRPMQGRVLLSLRQVEEVIAEHSPRAPSLFIFHVSRCGSTLLARLLSIDSSLVVSIEPDYLGRFLAQTYGLPPSEFSGMAKAMIRLAGIGLAEGQRLVIKFASHALHRFAEIRDCHPNVPAVLVYRDPASVLASSSSADWGFLRRRPQWLAELLGLRPAEAASMSAEELSAAYLEGVFRQAWEGANRFDRLIHYVELPCVLHEIRRSILKMDDALDDQAIQNVLRVHSKDPSRPYSFSPDSPPQKPAGSLRTPSDRMLASYYESLESCRSYRRQ